MSYIRDQERGKTVSILTFPDRTTGEVRHQEFRAQTWKAIPREFGGGYDFEKAANQWGCEGHEEIEAIRCLLNSEFGEPGRYRLVREGTNAASILELVDGGNVGASDLVNVVQAIGQVPDVVTALAGSHGGRMFGKAVELQRRRDQLTALRLLVEDATKTEHDIHGHLKEMGWVFGGRYVGEAERRQLTTGEILDVPLLRPDGSLHLVELKQASIVRLVRRHRGPRGEPQEVAGRRPERPLIVGDDVHEAVGQAMNYLRRLDEERDRILTQYAIDARRASVTVLIGHPKFAEGRFTEKR